jgi:hypothetical protein
MKILSIEKNSYDNKFISIQIEENEVCGCIPFDSSTELVFFPVDLDNKTHEIIVKQEKESSGLTGQIIKYKNSWAVGCGSGSAMGWNLNLTKENAINIAKGYCNVIESNSKIARIYY